MNIKILAGLFLLLLAAVVINKLVEQKKGDRTFKSEIIKFDQDQIDYIHIIPKSKEGEIVLKKDDGWKLLYEDHYVGADEAAIYDIFDQLTNLKPTRIAATKEYKWEEFEVTDSLATKVILKEKGDVVAELYIGKFDYKQPQGMPQYQMRQNPQFFTFVRAGGENEVYVVQQFLSMTFNRDINAFRNKVIVDAEKENWTKLAFTYPGDSSYFLMKQNGKWMMKGVMVDSVKIDNYFTNLSRKTSSGFVAVEKDMLGDPVYTLTIEGNNQKSIMVNAFPADSTHQFYITSSMNPDAVFSGKTANLVHDIFAGPSRFEIKYENEELDMSE